MEILTILFWIATLYGCQALPTTGCIKGSLKIREMKNLTCEQNSTFYTPLKIEPKCLTAALDCVKTELETIKQECGDPEEYINQGIYYLDLIIKNSRDKNHVLDSNDCPCEGWPTSNFTMFMNTLEHLCEQTFSLRKAEAH